MRFRYGMVAAVALIFSAGATTNALAASYNPEHLSSAQLQRIDNICQTTMGLNDWEALSLVWGAAQDPHLDPGGNHYQGCIASLSDAQRDVDSDRATVRADIACRAQGYREGTAGLAECVLRGQDAPLAVQPVDEPLTVGPPADRNKVGSFYTASPHEISRRERTACAQIGLNPVYAAYDNCVAHMTDTFDRIDNPHY
jgi:hypothetical protein